MSTSLVYRVRFRDSTDTSDVLIVSTAPAATSPDVGVPCLASIPTGEGTEIDPWSGKVTVGSYTFELIDVPTSGTARVFTALLDTIQIGCRTYIEQGTPGGAWTVLVPGYLTARSLVTALRWEGTIGEANRVQLIAQAFAPKITGYSLTGSAVYEDLTSYVARWPHRGALVGGPVTGPRPGQTGFGLPNLPFVRQYGGWVCKLAGDPDDSSETLLVVERGYGPSKYTTTHDIGDLQSTSDSATSQFRQVVANANAASATTAIHVNAASSVYTLAPLSVATFVFTP